jgi:hypothetical protein
MKLIHSLAIVAVAAGLGATGQSLGGSPSRGSQPAPSPSAQVETVPWLTEAWSDGEEEDAVTDPHAGLYDDADDSVGDPHAGLYAGDDDTAGATCPAGGGADDRAEVPSGSDGPVAGAASGAPRVERSHASNGKTVAEVFATRAALAEQRVRVRGTIVKLTENVLGKTYLHLQDGSGREPDGDADLTVTTAEPFDLGETVEVEGQLAIDQDVGVGYVYPALLSDATRVRP